MTGGCYCLNPRTLSLILSMLCLLHLSLISHVASSSPSNMATKSIAETMLSGDGKKCGSQGSGGTNCLPFHRYDPVALKKDKPVFNKCCRPCMEKFSGELSLLEIPNHVKHKALKRFTKYHEKFYKLHALNYQHVSASSNLNDYKKKKKKNNIKNTRHAKQAASTASLLETEGLEEEKSNIIKNSNRILLFQNTKVQRGDLSNSNSKGGSAPSKKSGKSGAGKGKKHGISIRRKRTDHLKGKKKHGRSSSHNRKNSNNLPKPPILPPMTKKKVPSPALPQPKPLIKLPKPGAAQGRRYVTGEEFLKHVPCCSICPEQFYLPADFDDFSKTAGQDDKYGAAFLEEEEIEADNNNAEVSMNHRRLENAQAKKMAKEGGSSNRKRKVGGKKKHKSGGKKKHKSGGKKKHKSGGKKQGKTGGKKQGKTGKKKPAGYVETKPEVVGGAELVEKIDKKQTPVDTKEPDETCCNICPSDEPSEGDIFSHFKPASPSFLETTSKNNLRNKNPGDVNIMGPSMVCCPVCPTLHEISHGPMEPMGGVFGLGKINVQSAAAINGS
jgi:hypothetical protein